MLLCFFGHQTGLAQLKEEMRAVKLTNVDSQILFSDEAIEEAIDYLASIGINAILPVTFNAAKTQFPSKVMQEYLGELIDPRMAGRDPFKRVLIEAHRHGMEVYPWFEYGFAAWYSGASDANGGPFGSKYPHWLSVDVNGAITKKNGFDWLNGLHPEVQTFMNRLVLEMVDTYDLDGIEFSDRIPALPVEGGYDSVTVQLYRSEKGTNPPDDYRDSDWKRWRANKLSDFYESLRDSVKKRDQQLIVASSPSLYPWGYEEYLQDNVMWVNHNIVDHYIPQLYRQNLTDYQYELNKTIDQTLQHKREMIFAGILMNVGSYTIPVTLLRDMLNFNRSVGLLGEAYFFYEGFKKNNGEIGEFLKNEFYNEEAVVPLRNGEIRRPKASIIKGKDAINKSEWNFSGKLNDFQKDSLFVRADFNSTNGIRYSSAVPVDGWYDVYYYNQQQSGLTISDSILVKTIGILGDSLITIPFNTTQYGWNYAASIPVSDKTASISIFPKEDGKEMYAPSVMFILNRKKSPSVKVLNTIVEEVRSNQRSKKIDLKIYPNPFNPTTTVSYKATKTGMYKVMVFSVIGEKILETRNQFVQRNGEFEYQLNMSSQHSGVYLLQLMVDGNIIGTSKLTLIK